MRKVALFACLIAGCTSGGVIGDRSEPIVDGRRETGFPEVVAVYRMVGGRGGLCTGTVIGPYAVLTAKHCAWDEDDDGDWSPAAPGAFIVLVATDINDPETIVEYAEVLEVRAPPGNDVNRDINFGDDIAILLLDRRLPSTTPRGVADASPDEFDSIAIVGFGRNNPDTDDSGVKYSGDTQVSDSGTRIFETYGDSATCQGDSGGPAFDSSGDVVGITSFGPGDCSIPASYFVVASRHAALIDDALTFEPPCMPEEEVCDGSDNNCDGEIDEGCSETGEPCADASECTGGECESFGGASICTEECLPYVDVSFCPSGFRCRPTGCGIGLCAPAGSGTAGSGAPCTTHDECASGQCADVGGTMRCGRQCYADDAPCRDGDICEVFVEGECGSCIPPELSTAPRAFGQDCDSDAICRSGDCSEDGFCTRACIDHSDCGAGFHCSADLCVRGDPSRQGGACESADDCHDSAPDCVDVDGSGRCAGECQAEGCATGFECAETDAGMRCIPAGNALGETCGGNDECRSHVCAGVCTVICDDSPCPEGYECRNAGIHDGCFLPDESDDGGCAVASARPSPVLPLFALGALLFLRAFARVLYRRGPNRRVECLRSTSSRSSSTTK
jgi:hypothetical protein